MPEIKVLPQEVADKIAAGEVAERPSAVVKELVENSMDAGATSIEVEIRKGGIEYIRVSDNGCGIDPNQVETAFLRHATSKLRDINDLYSIGTMGFRGEALASICAVAEVEVITKTSQNEEGVFLKLDHGKVSEKEPIACGIGTTMVVNNLFANIPARMKFLKRDATEAGYVADVLTRMALSRPELAITYTCDDKEVFSTSGDGKLQNTVLKLYGLDYAKAIIPVDYTEDNIRIFGVIGKPELARGNRSRQTFLVNNRYIKIHVASKIVSDAYRNSIMIGKFPFFVLNICIDPEFVDVNVHPAKTEIKFSNENRIYDILYHAVSNALRGGLSTPKPKTAGSIYASKNTAGENRQSEPNIAEPNGTESRTETTSYPYKPAYHQGTRRDEKPNPKIVKEYLENVVSADSIPKPVEENGMVYSGFNFLDEDSAENTADTQTNDNGIISVCEPSGDNKDSDLGETVQERFETILPKADDAGVSAEELPLPIGQAFDTYILCQKDNVFYMIDQHAAHERLRFERLKKSYYAHERMSQMLLSPMILKLDYSETQTVLSNLKTFSAFGFDIEDFGSGSIIVNATPIIADESEIRDLILEIAEALGETGKHSIADFEERALDMISCKYAIKANHKLNSAEMQELIEKVWVMAESGITTCPHGRPIKIEFTKTEIEKLFKRRV